MSLRGNNGNKSEGKEGFPSRGLSTSKGLEVRSSTGIGERVQSG